MINGMAISTIHQAKEEPSQVEIHSQLLHHNNEQARQNRELLGQHQITAINLMSSPGSGKTSLLERTITELENQYRIAVIEGDLETENDAARIRATGTPAVQITTGNACHLDAAMVASALYALELAHIDLLFIENVGNLICPASFDLGQHANVTLLSTTEGDDKPCKYPVIFRASELMVITKCDLLLLLDDFDTQRAIDNYLSVSGNDQTLQLSVKDGSNIDHWLEWVRATHEKATREIRS